MYKHLLSKQHFPFVELNLETIWNQINNDNNINKYTGLFKWIPISINIILFVFSVGLVGISSYVMIFMSKQCSTSFENDKAGLPFYFVLIIFNILGAFICMTSFLGCFGWITGNHKFLFTYAVVSAVLLLLLIGASVVILGPWEFKVQKTPKQCHPNSASLI